jgi:hypothetical protein
MNLLEKDSERELDDTVQKATIEIMNIMKRASEKLYMSLSVFGTACVLLRKYLKVSKNKIKPSFEKAHLAGALIFLSSKLEYVHMKLPHVAEFVFSFLNIPLKVQNDETKRRERL